MNLQSTEGSCRYFDRPIKLLEVCHSLESGKCEELWEKGWKPVIYYGTLLYLRLGTVGGILVLMCSDPRCQLQHLPSCFSYPSYIQLLLQQFRY